MTGLELLSSRAPRRGLLTSHLNSCQGTNRKDFEKEQYARELSVNTECAGAQWVFVTVY